MPLRTCIACRKKGEQATLFRVRARETEGRGAYSCRNAACLDKTLKRLAQALRTTISPEYRARLTEQINHVIQ
ncbi:MAG: YlxR family protein [Chthonomonas sp.]|nr:YlxR family protein [Chthonomonas sp.]